MFNEKDGISRSETTLKSDCTLEEVVADSEKILNALSEAIATLESSLCQVYGAHRVFAAKGSPTVMPKADSECLLDTLRLQNSGFSYQISRIRNLVDVTR